MAGVGPGDDATADPNAEIRGQEGQPGGELRPDVLVEPAARDGGVVEATAEKGGPRRFGHGFEEGSEVDVARRRPQRHGQERVEEQPHGKP